MGNYIVIDETMIWWTGQGDVHVSYIPRKPTPLGIELKTACCGDSSILLNIDLVEGKVVDRQKAYMDKVQYPSTATTLRLAEPWKGSGRVVIADSWFGSCRTAEWLWDELGLYSILCVKNGHKGFPRA